jgi:2'-5' RNA ligase
MTQRTILLFPQFEQKQIIDDLRYRYDPLAGVIQPHITLVFPFESDLSIVELREHVERVLANVPSFAVRLQGITGAPGGYLFLNVKAGNDQLIELHDRLYTGVLANDLNHQITYVPHMTIGRLANPVEWDEALQEMASVNESFATVICEVWIETIGDGGKSILEWKMPLTSNG